jgi:hypothetical protein
VAQVLELPAEKLLSVAGSAEATDPTLTSAAVRFATDASPAEKLSAAEKAALGEFLKVLTMV